MHFDHDQLGFPGVAQPVGSAGLDKGRFVGVEPQITVAIGDLCSAADHDPVLAAPLVYLQGQRGPGLDHDALDLEPGAFLQHGVSAPRAGDGAVQAVGIVALALERLGDVPDVLAAPGVCHKQCIRRVDNDQVVESDRAHKAFRRIDVAVMHIVQYVFARTLVAILVSPGQFAHRLP